MHIFVEASHLHAIAQDPNLPVVLKQRKMQEYEAAAADHQIRLVDFGSGVARMDVSRSTPALIYSYLELLGVKAVSIEPADLVAYAPNSIEARMLVASVSEKPKTVEDAAMRDALAQKLQGVPIEELQNTIESLIHSLLPSQGASAANFDAIVSPQHEEQIVAELRKAGLHVPNAWPEETHRGPDMTGWKEQYERDNPSNYRKFSDSDGIIDL